MKRALKNQIARARNHKFYAKARKAGYRKSSIWITQRLGEEIARMAVRLAVPKESVIRAAAECGLRHLTAGEVQRSDHHWHGTINLPMPKMVKLGLCRATRNRLTNKFTGFEPVTKSA